MEFLRSQPDGAFDLAIVDPPYFSGPEKRGYYGSKVSSVGGVRSYEKSDEWNVPGEEYFRELLRVAKHYIVWGCNYYDFRFAPGRIIWDKCNQSSTFSDAEIAATDLIDSVRLFPFMWNGMLQGRSVEDGRTMQGNKALNEKRIHPTQKPVALYVWLLQRFAKPGWKILDTHLGSGSSRIAAYGLGYDFTGCEIDKKYYDAQNERFEREVRCIQQVKGTKIYQPLLFGENNTQEHSSGTVSRQMKTDSGRCPIKE